ncbi:MAG: hypothetical protein C0405_14320, partial [Desulfovibrio sp.]|nr:hypothetical protein [Desulfovibrio sp.]
MTLFPAPPGVKAPPLAGLPPWAAVALAEAPGPGPLLLGVSGGGDSVAMLRLLHMAAGQRGWRLHVGHVDHGLRRNSQADARWVERL